MSTKLYQKSFSFWHENSIGLSKMQFTYPEEVFGQRIFVWKKIVYSNTRPLLEKVFWVSLFVLVKDVKNDASYASGRTLWRLVSFGDKLTFLPFWEFEQYKNQTFGQKIMEDFEFAFNVSRGPIWAINFFWRFSSI